MKQKILSCINTLRVLVLFFSLFISVLGFSQASSVVLNGDFEDGTDDWEFDSFTNGTTSPFYTSSDGSPLNYLGEDLGTYGSGGAKWRASTTSAGDFFSSASRYAYQALQLTPGEEYIFEFEYAIKTDVATDPTGGRRIVGTVINGHFSDGADVIDSSNGGAIKSNLEIVSIVGSEVKGRTSFKKVFTSFIAPETGEVSLVFYAVTSVDTYLDNVKIYSDEGYLKDETFYKAVEDCLATNPVDGLCADQEFGAMPDWEVGLVTNMEEAFSNNSSFNADISGWDVSGVTNMRRMFYDANSFNQNLGSWNLSSVTNMSEMLSFSGMTSYNYNASLSGWSDSATTSNNIELGADALTYCDETDRDYLINTKGWTILNDNTCYTETDFTAFELTSQIEAAQIDTENHTVNISVFQEVDVTNLKPYFVLSDEASSSINGIVQESGVTANDFTNSIIYTVTAKDGSVQDWTITVTKDTYTCIDAYPYNESFEDGLGVWSQSVFTNDAYWITTSGGTGSQITGPSGAIDGDYYLFVRAINSFYYNKSSDMVSGCFDLSSISNPLFLLSYQMFGASVGSLQVDISTDYRVTWTDLWSKSGNQGEEWKDAIIDLSSYKTQNPIFFRIRATTSDGSPGNIAIDNIRIKEGNSTSKEINSFKVIGQFSEPVIDNVNRTITVAFLESVDLSNLAASFSISEGATANINGVEQNSNVSENDFTNNLTYTIVAEDGSSEDWIISTASIIDSPTYDFVTTWKTDNTNYYSSSSTEITIPTYSAYKYNYEVDWDNDGVFDEHNISGNVTHNFGVEGTYIIRIRGVFPAIFFDNTGDADKILSVDQWGSNMWESMGSAFFGCDNLSYAGSDTPNLSNVSSMKKMFLNADAFNQDIGGWDVSNVEDMYGVFGNTDAFNQDISSWDVSNVKVFQYMFGFSGAFNQDISNWDVSNAITFSAMFKGADAFNQDIGGWDVSNVKSMWSMFESSSFNQDISSWDVSSVINMRDMFESSSFNQDIGGWDVSNVEFMGGMFEEAEVFNQDISSWDLSHLSTMSDMFNGAISFDQDLGSWNLSSATNMEDMFNSSGMSVVNYDATLSGWSKNENIPENIEFGAEGLIYCNAESDRLYLIEEKGWTIAGDVLDCEGVEILSSETFTKGEVLLYPNPVKDVFYIAFPEVSGKTVAVEVFDVFGSRVLSKEKELIENKIQLSLGNLSSGVYLVKVNYNGYQSVKIIKE